MKKQNNTSKVNIKRIKDPQDVEEDLEEFSLKDGETVDFFNRKNPIYTNKSGQDYLDNFFLKNSSEAILGAMSFTIGKYASRLGEKDEIIKELRKIIDYSQRYIEHLESKKESK